MGKYLGSKVYLLIDANARIGSERSTAVGPLEPDEENDNGVRFRTFMDERRLVAINTFVGPGYTWQGSLGHRWRLDYIVTHTMDFDEVRNCWVEYGIDLATGVRSDHWPVITDVKLAALPPVPERIPYEQCLRTRKMRLDRDKMADQQKLYYFQRDLFSLWAKTSGNRLDTASYIDGTLEQWNVGLIRIANSFFGRKDKIPRKSWISNATWIILRRISPMRRKMYRAACVLKQFMARTILIQWSSAVRRHPHDEFIYWSWSGNWL